MLTHLALETMVEVEMVVVVMVVLTQQQVIKYLQQVQLLTLAVVEEDKVTLVLMQVMVGLEL